MFTDYLSLRCEVKSNNLSINHCVKNYIFSNMLVSIIPNVIHY